MSQRNEHLDLIIDELERYGLRGEVSDRGKHLEVAWTTPHGRRFVIAARTPSDWRAGLNTRSEVRKLLKADNMQPAAINNLSFQKAMSLPKPVLPQEHVLQRDVIALTDMVFELQGQLDSMKEYIAEALREQLSAMTVTSKVSFDPQKNEDVEVPRKVWEAPVVKKVKKTDVVWSLLSTQFREKSDLIKESGINSAHVNTILQKFRREGKVENGLRGQWRRKT